MGKLEEFSPVGGVLAHFIANGAFGYGYGLLNSAILLHDERCGVSQQIFPGFVCAEFEDLTGQRCVGQYMKEDTRFHRPEGCRAACCGDERCEVWQFTKTRTCWSGRSSDCRRDIPGAADIV